MARDAKSFFLDEQIEGVRLAQVHVQYLTGCTRGISAKSIHQRLRWLKRARDGNDDSGRFLLAQEGQLLR